MLDAESYYTMRRPRFLRTLMKLFMLGMIAVGAVECLRFYF